MGKKICMYTHWHLLSGWDEGGGSWTGESCGADLLYSAYAE